VFGGAGGGISLFAAAELGRQYWGTELNLDAEENEMEWHPRGVERLDPAIGEGRRSA
jgi:hypothetical protein